MANGYMGRLLFIDLTRGAITEEPYPDDIGRDYIGGYGLGVRILYDRMKPGVDPLGPDNMLGFVGGPLTGTPALTSGRYTVVGKSPLTGTWGDASSGGDFGPYMKFAGYDGIFFSGISPTPVYLWLDNGKAELRDATDLWGKDTQYTDDLLRERHGKRDTRVACVGPAGERLVKIACVMNDKGRAAGRSGLGAVMGSKRLKAIAATGTMPVPVANRAAATRLRKKWATRLNEGGELFHDYGTAGLTEAAAETGDGPIKNWGGSFVDFPEVADIGTDAVMSAQARRYGCWRCTISCGGHMKPRAGRAKDSHKPEYETLNMSGSNILNSDLESIIRFNDLCNAEGMDTISAGAAVAFAVECYQNEILDHRYVGMDLNWRNGDAVVELAGKIARREGIGDILAEGVKVAAERIGSGSEEYAVHSGGQELPAHDPKLVPALAVTYRMDATPGRHTQGGAGWIMGSEFMEDTREDKYSPDGFGELQNRATSMVHLVNASGICLFGYTSYDIEFLQEFMTEITGNSYTLDELVNVGERIGTLRHMFNLREGMNPLDLHMNPRAIGEPPQKEGPNAGVTIDARALTEDYLRAMEWDSQTTRPSNSKLQKLGLLELVGPG